MGFINITRLFENLVSEIKEYSESLNLKSEQILKEVSIKKNYEILYNLVDEHKKVSLILNNLQKLKQEWEEINLNKVKKFIDSDYPSIQQEKDDFHRTPVKIFVIPLLESLEELGGKAKSAEVIKKVHSKMKDKLTKNDYELLPKKREIRWVNTLRWTRQYLININLLKSDSFYGIWEISENGREYLQKNKILDEKNE